MSEIATINFSLDKKGTTLFITGPKVKVGPASVNPSIGVRRNPQGQYELVLGHKKTTFAPAKLVSFPTNSRSWLLACRPRA